MLASDAQLLFDTVREAGELGLSLAARKNLQHWTKPDGSHVTEGDLAINALFEDRLKARRPEDGWLSEETPDTDQRLRQQRLWIIDPIDGTRAFMEGRKDWCVAAALAVNGRPVLAAVYQPALNAFYRAEAGQGAALNGEPLRIPDAETLEGAQIAGNRKALGALSFTGINADYSGKLPLQLRLAAVAAGELLVIEAGGLVSGTSGEGYIYNRSEPWQQGLVAAGPKRHAALINALRMT